MTIGLGQDGYDMGKEAYDLGNGVTVDPDNEESFAYSKAPDFTLEEIFSLDVFLDYPAAWRVVSRRTSCCPAPPGRAVAPRLLAAGRLPSVA